MQVIHHILQALNPLSRSCAGVDELSVVVDNTLDEALLLEVGDGATGKRSVDLHAVDEDRLRDDLVGGDLLHDTVAAMLVKFGQKQQRRQRQYSLDGLVEGNGVVGLVLYLALGPLLLLTAC